MPGMNQRGKYNNHGNSNYQNQMYSNTNTHTHQQNKMQQNIYGNQQQQQQMNQQMSYSSNMTHHVPVPQQNLIDPLQVLTQAHNLNQQQQLNAAVAALNSQNQLGAGLGLTLNGGGNGNPYLSGGNSHLNLGAATTTSYPTLLTNTLNGFGNENLNGVQNQNVANTPVFLTNVGLSSPHMGPISHANIHTTQQRLGGNHHTKNPGNNMRRDSQMSFTGNNNQYLNLNKNSNIYGNLPNLSSPTGGSYLQGQSQTNNANGRQYYNYPYSQYQPELPPFPMEVLEKAQKEEKKLRGMSRFLNENEKMKNKNQDDVAGEKDVEEDHIEEEEEEQQQNHDEEVCEVGNDDQPTTELEQKEANLTTQETNNSPTTTDTRTTVMLRHIPNKFTQRMVLNELNQRGFEAKYDFFYLPIDFSNRINIGYAFVNLVTPEDAQKFIEQFDGQQFSSCGSQKITRCSYAKVQGPCLFQDGKQVSFPPPDAPLPPIIVRHQRKQPNSRVGGDGRNMRKKNFHHTNHSGNNNLPSMLKKQIVDEEKIVVNEDDKSGKNPDEKEEEQSAVTPQENTENNDEVVVDVSEKQIEDKTEKMVELKLSPRRKNNEDEVACVGVDHDDE